MTLLLNDYWSLKLGRKKEKDNFLGFYKQRGGKLSILVFDPDQPNDFNNNLNNEEESSRLEEQRIVDYLNIFLNSLEFKKYINGLVKDEIKNVLFKNISEEGINKFLDLFDIVNEEDPPDKEEDKDPDG